VAEVVGPPGSLAPINIPPVKVMQTLPVASYKQVAPGQWLYDFGMNHAGRPKVVLKGPRGAVVQMWPAERLREDGNITQASTGTPSYWQVTLRGEGEEAWTPLFFTYGHRWVLVIGAAPEGKGVEGEVEVLSMQSQFVHSSLRTVGSFTSSKEAYNGIHEIIVRAMRSNIQTVITDCPHRERLGWLEVPWLLAVGHSFMFDMRALHNKVVKVSHMCHPSFLPAA
jgi:hypothetical protein